MPRRKKRTEHREKRERYERMSFKVTDNKHIKYDMFPVFIASQTSTLDPLFAVVLSLIVMLCALLNLLMTCHEQIMLILNSNNGQIISGFSLAIMWFLFIVYLAEHDN